MTYPNPALLIESITHLSEWQRLEGQRSDPSSPGPFGDPNIQTFVSNKHAGLELSFGVKEAPVKREREWQEEWTKALHSDAYLVTYWYELLFNGRAVWREKLIGIHAVTNRPGVYTLCELVPHQKDRIISASQRARARTMHWMALGRHDSYDAMLSALGFEPLLDADGEEI